MGVTYCCHSTGEMNRLESLQMAQMAQLSPLDQNTPAGLPNMRKVMSDASQRVRALKRTINTEDYENKNPIDTPGGPNDDY